MTSLVARPWPIGRSAHPAGGITSTTRDLLRYARLHLEPPPELAAMQEPQADAAEDGEWVGLTWYGEDAFGTIRHGGGTKGQLSLLVLQPRTGFALAVLTNHSPNGLQVIDAALEAAGLRGPAPEEVHDAPVEGYAGVYETPWVASRSLRPAADPHRPRVVRRLPHARVASPADAAADGRLLLHARALDGQRRRLERDTRPLHPDGHGRRRWLRAGGRLYRRVSGAPLQSS